MRGQAWPCLTLRVLLSTDPLPSAYPSPGPSLPCRAPTLGLQAHPDPLLLPKKRPSQVLPWLLSLQPLQALRHFHAWCPRAVLSPKHLHPEALEWDQEVTTPMSCCVPSVWK